MATQAFDSASSQQACAQVRINGREARHGEEDSVTGFEGECVSDALCASRRLRPKSVDRISCACVKASTRFQHHYPVRTNTDSYSCDGRSDRRSPSLYPGMGIQIHIGSFRIRRRVASSFFWLPLCRRTSSAHSRSLRQQSLLGFLLFQRSLRSPPSSPGLAGFFCERR